MKFESLSIKNAIESIEKGKIFLPPIQRSFVWDYARIIRLFDSLYRNYPIGNFIFWKLNPETSKNYPLYKFTKDYSENKSKIIKNESAPNNILSKDVHAVVDGQQRLSSMYIGLEGTYKYKKTGKGLQNVEANFIKSKLHVNLFSSEKSKEEENLFDFLSEEDAVIFNEKNLWFELGKILSWKNNTQAEILVAEIEMKVAAINKKTLSFRFQNRKEKITLQLKALFEMLNDERLYFFDIDNQNLDEVVDVFTRVNSGGMTLKKSDLLFSILVAEWNEGRDEIRDIVESMRDCDVNISQDFIMRACLVLSDLPVKYKLESFTTKNISIIKKNWKDIKTSLMTLCDLLPEIGYINHPNLSDNALIPIAYYIKKGGSYKSQKAKKSLQLYYVISQVNGIFGAQGDQILEKIRSEIKRQLEIESTLNYQNLINLKLPGNKTFELSLMDLEYLIENTVYGSPHAYFLLSLIYPTVDFKIRRYEVDHVHPRSKFNISNLKNSGVDNDEIIENWIQEKRDLLPNLQLLASKDNSNKRAKTIIEYLRAKPFRERRDFEKENLLPQDYKLLDLKRFDEFFNYRKKQLIKKLKKHFTI